MKRSLITSWPFLIVGILWTLPTAAFLSSLLGYHQALYGTNNQDPWNWWLLSTHIPLSIFLVSRFFRLLVMLSVKFDVWEAGWESWKNRKKKPILKGDAANQAFLKKNKLPKKEYKRLEVKNIPDPKEVHRIARTIIPRARSYYDLSKEEQEKVMYEWRQQGAPQKILDLIRE